VLRALCLYEGASPKSEGLLEQLAVVSKDTESSVDLARTGERNLIRNSQQYWTALGVLTKTNPTIGISEFGRKVCEGNLTQAEFAATVVTTLTLPNARIESAEVLEKWYAAGIKFQPLLLLLNIMSELGTSPGAAYLTKQELVKIVIPLSAVNQLSRDHADTILAYRQSPEAFATWPNCTPRANDHRMAHEFLLFLAKYGFITPLAEKTTYALSDLTVDDVATLNEVDPLQPIAEAAAEIQNTEVPSSTERRRVTREVLSRPQQAQFRKNVLQASKGVCLVTGTRLERVLEAAHIVPVASSGLDTTGNGLCLRSDIHVLFDAGHLRIHSSGYIALSEKASADKTYSGFEEVDLPTYVDLKHMDWRWNYV
jgi:hypothetical protein